MTQERSTDRLEQWGIETFEAIFAIYWARPEIYVLGDDHRFQQPSAMPKSYRLNLMPLGSILRS